MYLSPTVIMVTGKKVQRCKGSGSVYREGSGNTNPVHPDTMIETGHSTLVFPIRFKERSWDETTLCPSDVT